MKRMLLPLLVAPASCPEVTVTLHHVGKLAAGLKPEEDYTFFCSAPGHMAVMKGKFLLGK